MVEIYLRDPFKSPCRPLFQLSGTRSMAIWRRLSHLELQDAEALAKEPGDRYRAKTVRRSFSEGAWISKVLGEVETTEHTENLSYGANTIRDGVSLSQHTQI